MQLWELPDEVLRYILRLLPRFVTYQLIRNCQIGRIACNLYYEHVYIMAAYCCYHFDQDIYIGFTKALSANDEDYIPRFSSPRAFALFCKEHSHFSPTKITIAGAHNLLIFRNKYSWVLDSATIIDYEESVHDSMMLNSMKIQFNKITLRNNSNFTLPVEVNSLNLENVTLQKHSIVRELHLTLVDYTMDDLNSFSNLQSLELDSCFVDFKVDLQQLKSLSIGKFHNCDVSNLKSLTSLKLGTHYSDNSVDLPPSLEILSIKDPAILTTSTRVLPNLKHLALIIITAPSSLEEYDYCGKMPNLRMLEVDMKQHRYYVEPLELQQILKLPNSIEKLTCLNTARGIKNLRLPRNLRDFTFLPGLPYCWTPNKALNLERLETSLLGDFDSSLFRHLRSLILSVTDSVSLNLCQCYRLQYIEVTSDSIKEIRLPLHAENIFLNCPKLNHLENTEGLALAKLTVCSAYGLFVGEGLLDLDIQLLTDNDISTIHIPRKLRHLKIEGSFELIENEFFRTLPDSLENLVLNNCGAIISPAKLPKLLKNLSLAGNRITETFPIGTDLISLNLRSNCITKLDTNHLPESLTAFNISKNQLEVVEGDLRHTKLELIDLLRNLIRSGHLILPRSLETINTSHNEYKSTEWLDFRECDRLNHVYLSFANLTSFDNVRQLADLEDEELLIK